MSILNQLLDGQSLVTKDGEKPSKDVMAGVKLLGIYYSMNSCPPCHEFTPIMAALYEEINESEKVWEVIFASGDKKQEDFTSYYGLMPWAAFSFQDPRVKEGAMHF